MRGRAGGLALGGFALICRASPAFCRWWMANAALPASRALHALTARLSFPVIEPLALLAVGALLGAIPRRGRGVVRALLIPVALCVLLWLPARALPPEHAAAEATPAQLTRLCEGLIDALNRSPLEFLAAGETARLAGDGVKMARWPEWMRALGISGLYMPLTGAVLLDPALPPALAPFTVRHEQAHLRGVADEAEANLRAWSACAEAGGFWADSARLWALRYAMGRLRDEGETRRLTRRMTDGLRDLFTRVGGPILPEDGRGGAYSRLADWLATTG